MRIQIDHLPEKTKSYTFEIKRADLKRLDKKYLGDKLICKATLKKDNDLILLKGEYQITLETPCDLCFSASIIDLAETFELDLVPVENRSEEGSDTEISLHSRDIDYYQGFEISLADYFEDQILLDLPLSAICSDNCRGICQQCGANLNTNPCKCEEQNLNNPFKVLKDLDLTK